MAGNEKAEKRKSVDGFAKIPKKTFTCSNSGCSSFVLLLSTVTRSTGRATYKPHPARKYQQRKRAKTSYRLPQLRTLAVVESRPPSKIDSNNRRRTRRRIESQERHCSSSELASPFSKIGYLHKERTKFI